MSKKQRKILIITASVIVAIVLLVFVFQLILSNILDKKLESALAENENIEYSIKVRKARVNLFTMTVILKDVDILPDSSFFEEVKAEKSVKKAVYRVSIPVIRIRNVHVFKLLRHKYIDINKLIIKRAVVEMFTVPQTQKKHASLRKKGDKLFNADTIQLSNISGLNLNLIELKGVTFRMINLKTNDTTFNAPDVSLDIQKIGLVKNEGENAGYKLIFKNIDFNLKSEKLMLPGGKYIFTFESMDFSMMDSILCFKGIKIEPRYSLSKMVSFSKYQYEIYNLNLKSIKIYDFYPRRFIHDSRVLISRIMIDGMDLSIFKDKSKPFNEAKRPLLPQQSLEKLKTNLFIDSVIFSNSKLVYSEKYPSRKEKMNVILGSLAGSITNISTINDSLNRNPLMKIDLAAKLQNKIDMGVEINLDLDSPVDTFSFSGYLKSGDLKSINDVTVPAIGAKVSNGYLDGLTFMANANPKLAMGEMTFLYHDLEGTIIRNDEMDENKFLTWIANKVIIENNPAKDKSPRTVPMYFERCEYKGIGNFLWKTVQSGVVGTIVPGKAKKQQNSIYVAKGMDPREIRRAERKEKRRQRKLERQANKK